MWLIYLNHGIRRKRAKETRGSFSHGRSIEDRPAEISDRNTSGHFEADTVLSGKRKGQAVATFVERKSRLTMLNGLMDEIVLQWLRLF